MSIQHEIIITIIVQTLNIININGLKGFSVVQQVADVGLVVYVIYLKKILVHFVCWGWGLMFF